jgi:hypothetical protein
MDQRENRQTPRDSLLVAAELRIAGSDEEFRIEVRNLSPAGMMGVGAVPVARGTSVRVNIGNIGWVEGVVAWVQDGRFGVAFQKEINPKRARRPAGTTKAEPRKRELCAAGADSHRGKA